MRLHLSEMFITSEKKEEDSSDPGDKSLSQSGAEMTSGSKEIEEERPSHVILTLNSYLLVFISPRSSCVLLSLERKEIIKK